MKTQEIQSAIALKLGITSLNPMQLAMSQAPVKGTIILLAPTGSGKTLAFAIDLLRSLTPGSMGLVLAPSRELASQIYDVVRPIALGLKTTLLTGGKSVADEAASLSVTPNILIATPGRLLDHINRGHIDVKDVSSWVIDEYDKCLELGFEEEMAKIARKIKDVKLLILTSATRLSSLPKYLPKDGKELVMDYSSTSSQPRNRMMITKVDSIAPDKLETLGQIVNSLEPGKKAIIFANHRESVERIYQWLRKQGYAVGMYHGGLEQNERENALEMLTNGSVSLLVSTDLGARGVDLGGGADAVIHYHLPPSAEAWTHRNGRTARIDASGDVYVITSEREDIPQYVTWDKEGVGRPQGGGRQAPYASLYFNLGKKEKISRGDIVGFLTAHGVPADAIGRIALRDHNAIAAVDADKAKDLLSTLKGEKIKGKAVRVSQLK